MKSKPLLVIFFICFGLFLFIGIRASQAVFDDQPLNRETLANSAPPLLQEETALPQPPDPFTLIVLVDDLESLNPLLEGVWLQRFTDGGAGSMFFPVFPSQAEDGVQRDLNLRGAFWLNEPGQPSQQFQTILQDRNLSWHRILILDYAALQEVGLILAEIDPAYLPLNQVGLASLSYSVENRGNVQINQGLLIADICGKLPLPVHNDLLQRFLEGFSGRIQISGALLLDFTQSWNLTSYCLFPTLTLPIR